MKDTNIKQEMMTLWQETFHDRDEYIRLVFDSYFNPDTIAFIKTEEGLLSALMGIPYEFKSVGGISLKGLYLCGLATRKEVRRKGLMSSLLEEINERARNSGFDFTFLIPADEGRRRYYRDRHYHDAFYKKTSHYVHGHDFGLAEGLELREYDGENEKEMTEFLSNYGDKIYESLHSVTLIHSQKDWNSVLKETLISEEPLYYIVREGEICSAAFATRKEDEMVIKKLVYDNKNFGKFLLGKIGEAFPKLNITLIHDLQYVVENENINQLWQPFYAQNNSARAEYEDIAEVEEPYNETLDAVAFGMIRVLDTAKMLEKIGWTDLKSLKGYSEEEILKILFRKPVGHKSDALEKILNLPELSLSMSLLLE